MLRSEKLEEKKKAKKKAKTTTYVLECASFLGPKNWGELSPTIKESASLKELKTNITSEKFPSYVIVNYVEHTLPTYLGYIY